MTRKATMRFLTAVLVSWAGLVVAIVSGVPEAAILVTPWAVLVVLGLPRAGRRQVEVDVEVDVDRVVVGDEIQITAQVSGAPGTVLVSCQPSRGFAGDAPGSRSTPSARLHDVMVGDQAGVRLHLDAAQWGVYDVGRVDVAVTEPYGLFRLVGGVDAGTFVRVHPKPSNIRNLVSPWLVRRVTGAHPSPLSGRGIEYADIRPFAAGDSLREINWKVSARSEELWVSQRHPDRATDMVLFLDAFVDSAHNVQSLFGQAIEGAVALAESHLAVADRVGLVDLGGTVRWLSPSGGRHQLLRITDHLLATRLHARAADRDLARLILRVLPPRSFVIALTPLLDERFIDALRIIVGRGHDVAVVECIEPASEDSEDPQLRLARQIWEAQRQMVRDTLGEHGIAVAQWRHGDDLDPTLIELSRRRRLTTAGRGR